MTQQNFGRKACARLSSAIAPTVVLGRYADSDKTLRDIRAQAIERFLINSNEYSAAAYDLCKNGGEGALMRLQSTIAGYHGSREMLTLYFDDDQFRSIAQNTENEEDELYNVCKNGHVAQLLPTFPWKLVALRLASPSGRRIPAIDRIAKRFQEIYSGAV